MRPVKLNVIAKVNVVSLPICSRFLRLLDDGFSVQCFATSEKWRIGAGLEGRFQAVMESPCIKVCVVEPASGLCSGCARTLAEIAGWATFQSAERRRIMAELPSRRLRALKVREALP